MQTLIPNTNSIHVTNVGELPACKMAKFLEVIPGIRPNVYVAKAWRRKASAAPVDAILITFDK